jgi:hypothetical protein
VLVGRVGVVEGGVSYFFTSVGVALVCIPRVS